MTVVSIDRDKRAKELARAVWPTLNASQQHGIRFGLFPADVMKAAEDDGIDGRAYAVALMDEASRNGGMRA